MKKIFKFLTSVVLLLATMLAPVSALAVNITVPQAISPGQILVGNANGTYTPTTATTVKQIVNQVGHGFSAGNWVGQTGSTTQPYALTNAIPGGIYQGVGIVSNVIDSDSFILQTGGDYADTNMIPGMTYYLSASTTALGTVVGYPPTTAGQVSAPVGFAKSGTLASIQIGRPSAVAQSAAISGINVGNDMISSTYFATSSVVADAAVIQKNLASNRVRIALPSYNNPVGVYNMRELAKYYKSLGYYVSYGVTGRTGGQNLTTFNAWVAQVPSEAAWADANNIDMFYIGNEEDNDAQLGQMGTVTWAQVSAAVLTLSTSVKSSYPDMRVVYSTAQGQVIRWHDFAYPSFGALDNLGFNMYDTLASFEPNIEFFQSQIGSKYFVTEWASNHPYYDMTHAPYNYTDAQYAADLASRSSTLKKFGLEAYFFALRYGGNTPISGNWNIYTNTNVFLPGAVSAFGGSTGNQVLTTPLILGDNQVFYFNDAKTSSLSSDITNFNIVAPEFGSLAISGRTYITSAQTPQLKVSYNSSNNVTATVSSTGATTLNATGSGAQFNFSDQVVVTSTATSTIGNFGGKLYAPAFRDAFEDICKAINDAYAALPAQGGIIEIPRGYEECAVMIDMSTNGKRALLQGAPGGGSVIRWNGTATSTRINWGIQASGIDHTSGCGIRDITFKGSSYATSSAVQTGIDIGGSNGSDCTVFDNVNIQEFGRGLYGGANVYHFAWYNGVIRANGNNILIDTANNSGEGYNFFNPFIIDGYATYGAEYRNCFVLGDYAAATVSIFGGSINSCQIKIGLQMIQFNMHGTHMENPSSDGAKYDYITVAESAYTNINLHGVLLFNGQTSKRPDRFINSMSASVAMYGVSAFNNGTQVPLLVDGFGNITWSGFNNTNGGVTNVIAGYGTVVNGTNSISRFASIGIGTSTPATIFHVSAGLNATTTIDVGALDVTSKSCFNARNNTGAATSFYFVGTTMVVEAKRCI